MRAAEDPWNRPLNSVTRKGENSVVSLEPTANCLQTCDYCDTITRCSCAVSGVHPIALENLLWEHRWIGSGSGSFGTEREAVT